MAAQVSGARDVLCTVRALPHWKSSLHISKMSSVLSGGISRWTGGEFPELWNAGVALGGVSVGVIVLPLPSTAVGETHRDSELQVSVFQQPSSVCHPREPRAGLQ